MTNQRAGWSSQTLRSGGREARE